MVAKIVPFLFRAPRSNDWTQEEIAEFYRIEHALVQARLQVETDRGLSDEGEPWFAFCRGDGEVLVHIARDGSSYLMHATGLQAPIRARRLVDLARTFVDQFRVGATLEQATTGSTLLIHPVAMLAMVICAIFAANDDGVSHGASVAPAEANNAPQPGAPSGPVALYQSFEKVLAAVMGQAAALETHKDSVYLTIVCSIVAAIGVAAPMPEEAAGTSEVTHAVEAVEGQDVAASHDFSDGESALAFDASPLHVTVAWSVAVSDLLQEPSDDTIVAMASLVPTSIVAASFIDNRPSLTDDTSSIRIDQWRPEPGATPQPVITTQSPAESAGTSPHSASPPATRVEPATASVKLASGPMEEFGTNKVDQLLQLLSKGLPSAGDSHLGSEFGQAPPGIAQALSQILADTGGPAHAEESRVTYFPTFDKAGQKALVDFLTAFPNAPVVFSEKQIVIYDGAKDFDSEHVTIRIWEFDSGQTIALVGHVDNPAAHTGTLA